MHSPSSLPLSTRSCSSVLMVGERHTVDSILVYSDYVCACTQIIYVYMCVCMYVCIAGSAGDRDAPQLIIENRAVTVEFARDRDRDFDRSRDHRDPVSGSRHDQTSRRPVKSDWLCDTVSHSFHL